jgi:hypothetical protein
MPMQTETLTPATEASEIPKLVAKLREAFESDAVPERVLEQTSSGGACVNATVMHVAVPDLPFGGVGPAAWATITARRASTSSVTARAFS